jgi:hypothetical protein
MKKVSSESLSKDIHRKITRSIPQKKRSPLSLKVFKAECPLLADSGRSGPENV